VEYTHTLTIKVEGSGAATTKPNPGTCNEWANYRWMGQGQGLGGSAGLEESHGEEREEVSAVCVSGAYESVMTGSS